MDRPPAKTPQEKKALSYANDRRNIFGENDKASRKAIPARKAGENRKVRRKASQAVDCIMMLNEEAASVAESSLRHDIERVGGWQKSPDALLSEFIEQQARRRSWRGPPPSREPVDDAKGS